MASGQLLAELLVPDSVRHELEVQPRPLLVGGEVDEVGRRRLGLLQRLLRSGQCAVEPLELLREALVEHDQEQLLLALEVGVEGALGVAGRLGHLFDGGALESLPAEQLGGGPEQRGPSALLLLPPSEGAHCRITSASRLGVSVIARRSTGSAWGRAGRGLGPSEQLAQHHPHFELGE